MAVSANRLELLQIADAVAREKSIDRMIVIEAMQDAIQKAARSRYGAETEIKAEINPSTGELRMWRLLEIVEDVEEHSRQIDLEGARLRQPKAELGDFITEPLPPIEFGRIAAQSAKQVIVQKVRDAERERMYDEFKDRIGDVINGTVKRVEYGNVIVDLGRGEAIIRRDELIPRETFRYGDRVRAYIHDVRQEQRGPQIFLSRTHPQFMAKLFMQEVPEIYDGVINIRSIARDPGSRAKIAVTSNDSSIDPVGACVGMRGSGGIGKMLVAIDQDELSNVRLYTDDALHLLRMLPAAQFDGAFLLYPDPWPKKKHNKRRFINHVTLSALARIIKPRGEFRVATDIDDYATWTLAHIQRHDQFDWPQVDTNSWREPWDGWEPTRYEQKAKREGRSSFYFSFKRV